MSSIRSLYKPIAPQPKSHATMVDLTDTATANANADEPGVLPPPPIGAAQPKAATLHYSTFARLWPQFNRVATATATINSNATVAASVASSTPRALPSSIKKNKPAVAATVAAAAAPARTPKHKRRDALRQALKNVQNACRIAIEELDDDCGGGDGNDDRYCSESGESIHSSVMDDLSSDGDDDGSSLDDFIDNSYDEKEKVKSKKTKATTTVPGKKLVRDYKFGGAGANRRFKMPGLALDDESISSCSSEAEDDEDSSSVILDDGDIADDNSNSSSSLNDLANTTAAVAAVVATTPESKKKIDAHIGDGSGGGEGEERNTQRG